MLHFPRWDYVPFSEMRPSMLPHMEWLGGLIEAVDRSTMHHWTPMLTDGNTLGLERFIAVLLDPCRVLHASIGVSDQSQGWYAGSFSTRRDRA